MRNQAKQVSLVISHKCHIRIQPVYGSNDKNKLVKTVASTHRDPIFVHLALSLSIF